MIIAGKKIRCVHCTSRRLVEVTTMQDEGRSFLCKDCNEITEVVLERLAEDADPAA